MKTTFVFALAAICTSSVAWTQDGLTYDFDGRVGLGWLDMHTADEINRGFGYEGVVFRAEGNARLSFSLADQLQLGAAARVSLQKGQPANYDTLVEFGPSREGEEFDDGDLDMAVYISVQPVTLSYGEMETAFDFATLEIEHGDSILDAGNAVWLNIGDGAGSLGYRGG